MTYLKKFSKEVKALLLFLLFFIFSDFIVIFLYSFGLDITKLNNFSKQNISIVINAIYILLLIFIYRKDLLSNLKKLKTNYRDYLEIGIPAYAVGIFGMIILNAILQFGLNLGLAGNEVAVREMIKNLPIQMFISACILAPFQEEMVFRKLLKEIFKNKKFFIVFSGLIFGAMHVVGNFTQISDILFILPYAFLGSTFAYIYTKTNNILVPILIHLLHNTILVLLQMNMF